MIKGDKAKLRTDEKYLKARVYEEFKKYDVYNRGLITAAAFSRVLEDLGLKYGQREAEKIMRHCVITEDGYVVYKDLIKVVSEDRRNGHASTKGDSSWDPAQPKDDESEGLPGTPSGDGPPTPIPQRPRSNAQNPTALRDFITDQTGKVRKVYARWDRGGYTDEEFKDIISKQLGIPLTENFERMLSLHGPSRNLSFAKLMHSLQIEDFVQRKARDPTMAPASGKGGTGGYGHGMSRGIGGTSAVATRGAGHPTRLALNPPRNPVTWNDGIKHHNPELGVGTIGAVPDPRGHESEECTPMAERIHWAICEFVDGRSPGLVFRTQLERSGIAITAVIDRLIRRHDSDNSVRFKDLAVEIFRNTRMDDVPGTGDRSQDFDDLRLVSGGMAGQMLWDRPYASGGAWSSEQPNSAPAKASPEGNGRTPETPERKLRMHTPYATDFHLPEGEVAAENMVSPQKRSLTRRSAPRTPPRATQGAGDIIAWREDGNDALDSSHEPNPVLRHEAELKGNVNVKDLSMPGWRSHGDIITWSNPDFAPGREDKIGKRLYGHVLDAAVTPVPWGTEKNAKSFVDPWLSKAEFRPALI